MAFVRSRKSAFADGAPLPMHMPATVGGFFPASGIGDDEIIIDDFAGGGGASEGILWATGRAPDVAQNHDAPACAMYRANHPSTLVLNQSVTTMAPIDTVMLASRHRAAQLEAANSNYKWDGKPMRVGLAWFSPDCTDHSRAKGSAPIRNRASRNLAWVIIKWAELPVHLRPRLILMENVAEWLGWCPTRQRVWPDGTELAGQPMFDLHGNPVMERDPDRKGETFRKWMRKLKRRGYTVEYRVLRASAYGAPTIRERLFLVARCDGLPIVWPAETHGGKAGLPPIRTVADCLDFSIPCPSIFLTKEEGRKLGVKRPLVEATNRRIARGVVRRVINAQQAFLIPITHQGDARIYPIDEALRTVTTAKRGEIALVTAQVERVAAFLAQHNGGPKNEKNPLSRPVTLPLSTIVTRGTQQRLVAVSLTKFKGTSRDGQGVDEAIGAINAQGQHYGLVAAFLQKYYSEGVQDQAIDDGLHTTTAKARFALVTVVIDGETYVITDIGMRMLTPRELYRCQAFNDNYIIDVKLEGDLLEADTRDRLAEGKKKRRSPWLTIEEQIRMCGNSVPPVMSMVLAAANLNMEPARPFGKMREAA